MNSCKPSSVSQIPAQSSSATRTVSLYACAESTATILLQPSPGRESWESGDAVRAKSNFRPRFSSSAATISPCCSRGFGKATADFQCEGMPHTTLLRSSLHRKCSTYSCGSASLHAFTAALVCIGGISSSTASSRLPAKNRCSGFGDTSGAVFWIRRSGGDPRSWRRTGIAACRGTPFL